MHLYLEKDNFSMHLHIKDSINNKVFTTYVCMLYTMLAHYGVIKHDAVLLIFLCTQMH